MSQKKQKLFTIDENLTAKGEILSTTFRNMIKTYLIEKSEMFSTIELETICSTELHALIAEIRLLQQIEKRNKNNPPKTSKGLFLGFYTSDNEDNFQLND